MDIQTLGPTYLPVAHYIVQQEVIDKAVEVERLEGTPLGYKTLGAVPVGLPERQVFLRRAEIGIIPAYLLQIRILDHHRQIVDGGPELIRLVKLSGEFEEHSRLLVDVDRRSAYPDLFRYLVEPLVPAVEP